MAKYIVPALLEGLYIFLITFWVYSVADYIKQKKFTLGFGFAVTMLIHSILVLTKLIFK